jgi:hypothetical protein
LSLRDETHSPIEAPEIILALIRPEAEGAADSKEDYKNLQEIAEDHDLKAALENQP